MADAQVFEETFSITNVNNEKYDRVSRLSGTSSDNQVTMTLDINHELFPVQAGESLNMVLATTLSLDGTSKEQNETQWRSIGRTSTLADMYEYVCYGKNYRMEDGEGDQMSVCAPMAAYRDCMLTLIANTMPASVVCCCTWRDLTENSAASRLTTSTCWSSTHSSHKNHMRHDRIE
jgi:DNA-directed RNA polymerases I, II, and III subunit RPABC3